MSSQTNFDVVICGGGLAGLTLARHLKLEMPELSVAVIDRLTRPLPEAAFKVGKSVTEMGTYYFGQVLQLDAYFRERHLPKLGMRFFMGKSQSRIEERPETGQSIFPLVPSYQIDRGRLENDLRDIVQKMGVELLEGTVIESITLADDDENHTIKCVQKNEQQQSFTLTARWVVDASGRRRLLQRQLGLSRESGHQASSAWWRYNERVDVNDVAAPESHAWRNSTIEDRYYSTNHLMDRGYWIWLIPLGSGATSVGIVTDEAIHPQNTYGRSYSQALTWMQQHEPVLWKFLKDKEPMDFLSFKNYSYASAQVFSHRRWSCVGEAGVFLDPLYSIGSEFITITNTVTVEMIRRERAGTLNESDVNTYNKLVLDIIYQTFRSNYRNTYRSFGHAQIFTAKLSWDTAINWAFVYQVYAQGFLVRPTAEVLALGERYRDLHERVQQLFIDWAENAPPRDIHVRGDMTRMRFLQLLHLELGMRREPALALDVARKNLDHFEELAQVLFWQAVEECYPENEMLKKRPWVNAWSMTLDPEKWEETGTFDTRTEPRPLDEMRNNFTGIFAPQSLRDRIFYNTTFNIMHWRKGLIHYNVVPVLHHKFVRYKPGMWIRKLFIKDRQPERV